jgi:hypothetical protein
MTITNEGCPWEHAYLDAVTAFGPELQSEGADYAVTMLKRRLGFLCLSEAEILSEIDNALDAAGIAVMTSGSLSISERISASERQRKPRRRISMVTA